MQYWILLVLLNLIFCVSPKWEKKIAVGIRFFFIESCLKLYGNNIVLCYSPYRTIVSTS